MTPWELAKETEHSHQRALFAWANCAALYGFQVADDPRGYTVDERRELIGGLGGIRPKPVPDLRRLFAIHNQGHGDKIRGNRAKAEGVKAGVPDIMLPFPISKPSPRGMVFYSGLFIELKLPKVGRTHGQQPEWIDYLQSVGYAAIVCYGWVEASKTIKEYLS